MNKPLIYLITPGKATDADFAAASREILATVRHATDEGVSLIQLREKKLSAKLVFQLASDAAKLMTGSRTRLLVNDRADIALAAGADGVHLTADSLPAKVIRANFPKDFLIGVSTHTLDETMAAAASGADFAVFGPVFSTPGKSEAKGLDLLADVCRATAPFPVLAIGGIDASNVKSVIASGASGIAAIRTLNEAASLGNICGSFRQ